MSSYRPNYTAVVRGREPGVYASWDEARRQTEGFPGAYFRSFPNHQAASGWFRAQSRKPSGESEVAGKKKKKIKLEPKRSLVTLSDDEDEPIMKDGQWSRSAAAQIEDDAPPLSTQQQQVLDRILNGENIFFTGAAGTGKSHLFRAIIKALRSSMGGAKTVAVTASTGMAALNVGGTTLHSWARIGLGTKEVKELIRNISKSKGARDAWTRTDVLLVDEISMISAELLDKLDKIGRALRHYHTRPFGGLQVVFCGDFFQLPPVQDRNGQTAKYAFEADVWDRAFPRSNQVTLDQVFRQAEESLVTALEHIRRGQITREASALLTKCNRPVACPEGTRPVQLYSRRFQVEKENNDNLAALPGETHVFTAVDVGGTNTNGYDVTQEQATRLLNSHTRWPETVSLKVGAQVMLVHENWQSGLVNGSTGRVVGFSTMADFGIDHDEDEEQDYIPFDDFPLKFKKDYGKQLFPVVDFESRNGLKSPPVLVPNMEITVENALGKMEAKRLQVPLILAWAITIHKAQGMTLSRVKVDLQGTFDVGQAYVALSRATTLDGLELRGFNYKHIMVSPRVLRWAEENAEDDEFDDWFAENAEELDAQLMSSSQAVGSSQA